MIDGDDIIFPIRGTPTVLDMCTRTFSKSWPDARYEDIATGNKYESYVDIPFGQIKELMIYRDAEVEKAWDDGVYINKKDEAAYVICGEKEFTIVVGDRKIPAISTSLAAIDRFVRQCLGLAGFYHCQ